jgi:tripartite-type tricarboxylate transporter receptor subunit TctC
MQAGKRFQADRNTTLSRRALMASAAAWLYGGVAPSALAQQFPGGRPIRIVTAVSPGSANDITARFIAEALAKRLGVGVVIVPKPGAGGILAEQEVARAPADGHTLVYGGIGHYIAQPLRGGTPSYDAGKDFAPIAKVASASVAVLVPADSPYKNLGDLVHAMRDKPGQLTYSTGGIGAAAHVCAVMLNDATQTRALHVPYKGTNAAMVDLASGQVDFACQAASAFVPFQQSGKVRVLAVASRRRWPQMPNVPTAAEAGVPDFELASGLSRLPPRRRRSSSCFPRSSCASRARPSSRSCATSRPSTSKSSTKPNGRQAPPGRTRNGNALPPC